MTFKPVGVDENSNFPTRVVNKLKTLFPALDGNGKVADSALPNRLQDAALSAAYVPSNPTLVVTYNPDGSVATTTENGVLTTFTYNTDGTVNTQTRAGVTKTFTYDANGNVTGAA